MMIPGGSARYDEVPNGQGAYQKILLARALAFLRHRSAQIQKNVVNENDVSYCDY